MAFALIAVPQFAGGNVEAVVGGPSDAFMISNSSDEKTKLLLALSELMDQRQPKVG